LCFVIVQELGVFQDTNRCGEFDSS
jgi:hypothetical protein